MPTLKQSARPSIATASGLGVGTAGRSDAGRTRATRTPSLGMIILAAFVALTIIRLLLRLIGIGGT